MVTLPMAASSLSCPDNVFLDAHARANLIQAQSTLMVHMSVDLHLKLTYSKPRFVTRSPHCCLFAVDVGSLYIDHRATA